MIKAILFDLDGVLLDTEWEYDAYLEDLGIRYFGEQGFARKVKGVPVAKIAELYFSDRALAEQFKAEAYDFELHMQLRYMPGSLEFLAAAKAHPGLKTALVTSSGTAKLEYLSRVHPELLEGLDTVVSADSIKQPKPAPDCFLEAVSRFGLAPEECLVIEDSLNGLRSGRSAGCRVLGLTTTFPLSEVAPLSDLTAPSLAGLSLDDLLF